MERLRYVARSSGADQGVLLRETAGSLGTFRDDAPALVMAFRRMLSRHPTSAPLWWLGSRVCTAVDPVREAWAAVEEYDEDQTARELSWALPEGGTICVLGWPEIVAEALPARGDLNVLVVDAVGEGSGLVRRLRRSDVDASDVPLSGLGAAVAESDVVLIEAVAVGPDTCLAIAGSLAAAAVAAHFSREVWLVAGVGRLLPGRLWDVVESRMHGSQAPWDREDDFLPLSLITKVAGPSGVEDPEVGLRRVNCPIAPELFKEGIL